MSIFVDESDSIKIAVHYTEEGGNLVVLDSPAEHATTLNVAFRRPDFSISQRLMATSTSTDSSGSQVVNLMMLQNNLIYFLARSWDAKEPDTTDAEGKVVKGKSVELSNENIGRLRVEIARALVNKLLAEVGQIL